MALKFKKKLLLAKVETGGYGVDAAPTGAANAILTKDLDIVPMEGDKVQRDVDRPTLGNDLSIHVGTYVSCSFKVEMAGSGVVDTPVAYAPLLRACAWNQTITATTDVQHKLVSTGEESATLYIQLDGQQHKMLGCRGSVSVTIDPKGIAYFNFSIKGLWVDPASVADAVPDFTGFKTPLAVTNTNTPIFSFFGQSLKLLNLSLDQNNDVIYRNVVGEESVQITDRSPSGSITVEAPKLSVWNAFTTAKANTTGVFLLSHGSVTGKIVQHTCPIVQIMNPKYGDSDGIRTLQMDLALIPSSAGDDEWNITTK